MTTQWRYVGRDKIASITEKRPALLEQLRTMTVTGELKNPIIIKYSGYGDSGGIDDSPVNLPDEAQDFLWDVLDHYEGGFENNDGGEGKIKWDLVEDKITVHHTFHYTESDQREHEF